MAAGKSAGSIFIDLLLNDAKFVSATTKTQTTIKKLSTTAVSAAKAASVAFTAAGAVVTAISINNIRNIDKTIKSARDLNLTVRDFQAIELVSKETGRSFKEINDNISLFSDRIKDAKEFNDRFNLSISELDASKIREANIVLARVSQTFNSLGTQLAIKFAPIVSHIGNLFIEAAGDGTKFFSIIDKGVEVGALGLDLLRRAIIGVRMTFNALILSIGDLVAKTSLVLYDLGVNLSKLLNKIPGVSVEAESGLLDVGLAAKNMADNAREGFDNLIDDAENFKKTLDIIKGIQDNYTPSEFPISPENKKNGGVSKKLKESANDVKKWGIDIESFSKKAAENIQDAFADFLFDPFDQGLKGMLKGFIDTVRRMIAEAQAAQLAKALFGESAGGSGGGFLGNIFGSIFGGGSGFNPATSAPARKPIQAFADGGYLGPGQFGIAGEAGAELLYGGKTGVSVFNQDQIGGRGTVYQIDARGTDPSVVRRIEQSLMALAGPGVIESRVSNAQTRGSLS